MHCWIRDKKSGSGSATLPRGRLSLSPPSPDIDRDNAMYPEEDFPISLGPPQTTVSSSAWRGVGLGLLTQLDGVTRKLNVVCPLLMFSRQPAHKVGMLRALVKSTANNCSSMPFPAAFRRLLPHSPLWPALKSPKLPFNFMYCMYCGKHMCSV